MGCTIGIIRWLMFIFNFICCLVGLALIALGTSVHFKVHEIIEAMGIEIGHLLSTGMIVVGCVIFVIAFFGCCGAVRESHCMVITFSLCLLTIVVIQIAAGIFVFLNRQKLVTDGGEIRRFFDEQFNNYYIKDKKDATFIVNKMQENLKCCGTDSPQYWTEKHEAIPVTCCASYKQNEVCNEPYQDGCIESFQKFMHKWSFNIGIAVIVLAIIEIGGIIAGLCLANSIRNEERRAYRV